MKLLAKNAEDRYQSASSLKKDLQTCEEQWHQHRKIPSFLIARHDIGLYAYIPQKFYGRQQEMNILTAAFERVSQGAAELMLVTGSVGSGKSALIQEMSKHIIENNGYFVCGKYSLCAYRPPYSGIIRAFRQLFQQILTETDERLRWWQNKFSNLEDNGKIIADIIPELQIILGEQPSVEEINIIQIQDRFHLSLQKFIAVFASFQHPLVLFLDDLQWIDAASLEFLTTILTTSKHLLIIGAYRDNEEKRISHLRSTLEKLKQDKMTVNNIKLENLSFPVVNQFVADMLRSTLEYAKELAGLVYQKTDGNPLFIKEILKELAKQHLLYLSPEGWFSYDTDKIMQMQISENIGLWLAKKITSSSSSTQQFLKLASCIGSTFELKLLISVCHLDAEILLGQLSQAINDGLILPAGNCYRFVHDKIQEAAYNMVAKDERTAMHLQIGKSLLQHTPHSKLEEKIFDIVDQINLGISLISDEQEKIAMARLNLIAGQKAKNAAASAAAIQYLTMANKFLKKDSWQYQYELSVNISINLAECEYIRGNLPGAKALCQIVLKHATNNIDKAKIYKLQSEFCTTAGEYKHAVISGLKGLKLFAINLPLFPGKFSLLLELLRLKWHLGKRKSADLPTMINSERQIAMLLLINITDPAYYVHKNLMIMITLKMMNISIKYGNADVSSYAYMHYGMVLSGSGALAKGYKFGQYALELNEKLPNVTLSCKLNFMFANFINFWHNHIKTSMAYYQKSLQLGAKAGCVNFMGYNKVAILCNMVVAGDRLIKVHERQREFCHFLTSSKFRENIHLLSIVRQTTLCLQGKTIGPSSFSDEKFREDNYVAQLIASKEKVCLHFYYVVKLKVLYLAGDYTQAIEIASTADKNIAEVFFSQIHLVEHYFYYSLVMTTLYFGAGTTKRKKYWRLLLRHCKLFKKWAKHCKENFQHKYLLISAEIARISGKNTQAAEFYDQAIVSARENEYTQILAIANELAAKFYLRQERFFIAEAYMRAAYSCYSHWGVTVKLQQLETKYPEIFATMNKEEPFANIDTYSANAIKIEIKTIIETSYALVDENCIDTLLAKLMRIIIEHTGSQKSCLLLEQQDKLVIQAQGMTAKGRLQISPSCEDMPMAWSIINYVKRTRQVVNLDDTRAENPFSRDPYMLQNTSKSILCIPLVKQSKFMGILYCENNLAINAFSKKRIKLLQLFCAQTAISIDNVRTYKKLQKKIAEHKKTQKTLKKINERLEETLAHLHKSQKQIIHQERLNALGQMTSGIAHDFNNILSPIVGYSDMLLKFPQYRNDSKKLLYYLELINTAAKDAANIVKRLREFYRLPEKETNFEPVDLNAIVKQAIKLAKPKWQAQSQANAINISLQMNLADIPKIQGNQTELRELLMNLIFNAVDAMEDDGKLSICTFKDTVYDPKTSYVILQISDTGGGMDEETRKNCFVPYFSTKKHQGTGMGLAMVYDSIQRHKGMIELDSEEGKGTTFTIYFPLSTINNISIQPFETVPKGPLKILLVEDDPIVRELLIEYITTDGNDVEIAADGREALAKFHADRFDMVVTDWAMPKMNGDQLAAMIKKQAPHTPVMMLTGFDKTEAQQQSPLVDILINKPISIQQLQEAFSKLQLK